MDSIMTTSVIITTTITGSNLVVNASLSDPADIPRDVFIYDNTGTAELGQYYGVSNFQDYARLQSWTGTPIPVFGNKYVKHTEANIVLPLTVTKESISAKLKRDLTQFKLEYLASGTSTEVSVI